MKEKETVIIWAVLNDLTIEVDECEYMHYIMISTSSAKGIVSFYAWCCDNELKVSSIQVTSEKYYVYVWFKK